MIDGGTIWLLSGQVQYELMLFALIGFLAIGTDEFGLDAAWLIRAVFRRITIYRRYRRSAVPDLVQPQKPPKFAVFVPAWHEASIIANTLALALQAYRGHDVTVFVGCYPNDVATREAVAALNDDRIVIAVNGRDGPTTKADCLNVVWQKMVAWESASRPHEIVVLHDAEDHVDPAEPLVFAALHHRFAMIQLPVMPFASPRRRWIGGHYCDEFAEAHLKAMVVREAVGAGLPSAGVGCALRRDYLDRRDEARPGMPFGSDTLTEDYELGLAAKAHGMACAFVRIRDEAGRLVATRAQFPHRIADAVRQKSRWVVGISIAGWDRIGWGNGIAEVWMRFRDRKALLSATLIVAGYASFVMAGIELAATTFTPVPRWPALSPTVIALLVMTSSLLVWRILMRFACVAYTYDVREALWSVPRMVVCNAIAILAAWRAILIFVRMSRSGQLVWEKTDHSDDDDPGEVSR